MTPKSYLSYSQMSVFERNPQEYADRYLYGKNHRISRNLKLGSDLAEGLEAGEATGNPLLDLVASRLPKFELMDQPILDEKGIEIFFERDKKKIKVPYLEDKKEKIPLLALPDTLHPTYSAFKEFKTSTKKWTQKQADESGQITFYATAIWLAKGFLPGDIELICATTEYDTEGRLRPTGDIWPIPTKRTLADIIKMTARIRRAWAGIKELCEKELI